MHVVSLKEFMALPSGTVYMDLTPNTVPCFDTLLKVKVSNMPDSDSDFNYYALTEDFANVKDYTDNDLYSDQLVEGKEVSLETRSIGRWGLFDHSAKFVILSTSEIRMLIGELASCLVAIEQNTRLVSAFPWVEINTGKSSALQCDERPSAMYANIGTSLVKLK